MEGPPFGFKLNKPVYTICMFNFLPVLVFVSVGWFLHDPVSLFSGSVLAVSSLVLLIALRKFQIPVRIKSYILWLIPTGYIVSAVINKQNLNLQDEGLKQTWKYFDCFSSKWNFWWDS
jgi:hypothetical protein